MTIKQTCGPELDAGPAKEHAIQDTIGAMWILY